VLVVFLAGRYPGSLDGAYAQAQLVERFLWGALIAGALAVRLRDRPTLVVRYAAIWVAIGAGLMLAYSFFT